MDIPTPSEIRAARKAAGLTQGEAAEIVHVSKIAWAKWEGGERRPLLAVWELFQIKVAARGQDR